MKKSYIFLADGFEEIEALTTVDVMRRAGMDITTVSVKGALEVNGAHNITVIADKLFEEESFKDIEWLILPGGMPGAVNLYEYEPLRLLLANHAEKDGKIAAICAAPAVVLAPMGLLNNVEATCYPGFEQACIEHGAVMRDAPVIDTQKIITGNGPSAAMGFALAIVQNSLGENAAQKVGSGMLYYHKNINFYF